MQRSQEVIKKPQKGKRDASGEREEMLSKFKSKIMAKLRQNYGGTQAESDNPYSSNRQQPQCLWTIIDQYKNKQEEARITQIEERKETNQKEAFTTCNMLMRVEKQLREERERKESIQMEKVQAEREIEQHEQADQRQRLSQNAREKLFQKYNRKRQHFLAFKKKMAKQAE